MKLRELLQKAEDETDSVARFAVIGYLTLHKEAIADLIEWAQQEVNATAAAAERDACAKLCDQTDENGEGPDCWDWHAKDYAAAIRARGEK